jgi:outer membrane protein OmpA-like peptidoglycan-associated protein
MGRHVVLAAVALILAGCSSVPDAANPMEWYRSTRDAITGKSDPDTAAKDAPVPGANEPVPNLSSVPPRPQTSSAQERQQMASGLVADRQAASRYSGEVIPRQNTQQQPAPPPRPTSAPPAAAPPAPSPSSAAPSPAQVQAAAPPPPPPQAASPPAQQASAPTPPPAVTPPAPPQTSAGQQQAAVPPPGAARTPPQLREVTPMAVPQGTAQPIQPSNIVIPRENPQAPQLAEVKPYVPPPGLDPIETVYIGGGGTTTVVGGAGATPTAFRSLPPPGTVAREVPGVRPLSAFSGAPRGSQQLATIQFANGSAKLSERDRSILREVANQYRQRGAASVRVIGHASSRTQAENLERHRVANAQVSAERAEAVARELVRMGVPAQAIYAGAVADANPKYHEFMPSGEAGNRRAEIFIDF